MRYKGSLLLASILCFILPAVYGQNVDSLRVSVARIQSMEGNIRTQKWKDLDARLYKDIDPEHYSIEGAQIHRLANIRYIKQVFPTIDYTLIDVQFNGENELLTTRYIYVQQTLIYAQKSWVAKQMDVKTLRNGEQSVALNGKTLAYYFMDGKVVDFRDFSSGLTVQQPDSIRVQETLLDARTYLEYR